LAVAEAEHLPWVPLVGETYAIRKVLWTNGGRYDPKTKTWSVPQHREAAMQEIIHQRREKNGAQTTPSSDEVACEAEPLSDVELITRLCAGGECRSEDRVRIEGYLAQGDGLFGILCDQKSTVAQRSALFESERKCLLHLADLVRRVAWARRKVRDPIHTPEQVRDLMGPLLAPLAQEEMWVLHLDIKSQLIGDPVMVSRGNFEGTDACPQIIYRLALSIGASRCIAVHNHPSGDVTPSPADISVTRRLAQVGQLIELPLADHVVIGDGGRFSSIRRLHPECFAPHLLRHQAA